LDELLDLLDNIDVLSGAGDLADAGLDLGVLAEHAGLVDFDPGVVEEFAGAAVDDPFNVLQAVGDAGDVAGDAPELLADGVLIAEMPTGEVVEFIVPSEETAPAIVGDALGDYPDDLLRGLNSVEAVPDGFADGVLGAYSPADGCIILDASDGDVLATMHHEVAHHVFERNPELTAELLPLLHESGFVADQATFLDAYDEQLRAAEACAEANAKFRANPLVFTLRYPQVAAFLERLLKDRRV
jgi:hypothetical protein